MTKQLSILIVSAALASSVGVAAQAPPVAAAQAAPVAAARRTHGLASTTLRVRGTIDKCDPATHTLWLTTSTGVVQFVLAPMAHIRQGWQRIDESALDMLAGHRAAVRYLDSPSGKTLESIHVFGDNRRTGQ